MKKLLLFIVFALAASVAQAQSYTRDSLFLKIMPPYELHAFEFRQPHSMMTSDGNILTCIPTKTMLNHRIVDFGDWLYKIDPVNGRVIDSVFVETDYYMIEDITHPLLANAPDGNGYILAKLIHKKLSYQGEPGETWLRISRVDEDLNVQPHDEALTVLLEDSMNINYLIGICIEGDQIVLAYRRAELSPVMARIGLDGTLHEQNAFDNLFLLSGATHSLNIFNDSPREYSLSDWVAGEEENHLVYHVFDSLLTLKESIVIEDHPYDIYNAQPGSGVGLLSLDDNTFIQTIKYKRNNITRTGACLQKYDKNTHECLGYALFESWPIYSAPDKMGYPIGMSKTVNDNIYFAYRTNNNVSGSSAIPKGWMGIAKLDKDLNILWQRYCLGSYSVTGYYHYYCHFCTIDDGFAMIGRIEKEGEDYNFFYYFVHDEDPDNIPEAEAFLRPYMFYPNPATDQLHLQYSPDVQPTQIELFDLQGRLVRTQTDSLETLDLQGLATGQYLMKVTLANGKSYTDKVVKE